MVALLNGRGSRIAMGQITQPPLPRRVLRLTFDEADRLGRERIETELLLLAPAAQARDRRAE